jgi:hypothetical protein
MNPLPYVEAVASVKTEEEREFERGIEEGRIQKYGID